MGHDEQTRSHRCSLATRRHCHSNSPLQTHTDYARLETRDSRHPNLARSFILRPLWSYWRRSNIHQYPRKSRIGNWPCSSITTTAHRSKCPELRCDSRYLANRLIPYSLICISHRSKADVDYRPWVLNCCIHVGQTP
jgi:hypothetical protein